MIYFVLLPGRVLVQQFYLLYLQVKLQDITYIITVVWSRSSVTFVGVVTKQFYQSSLNNKNSMLEFLTRLR